VLDCTLVPPSRKRQGRRRRGVATSAIAPNSPLLLLKTSPRDQLALSDLVCTSQSGHFGGSLLVCRGSTGHCALPLLVCRSQSGQVGASRLVGGSLTGHSGAFGLVCGSRSAHAVMAWLVCGSARLRRWPRRLHCRSHPRRQRAVRLLSRTPTASRLRFQVPKGRAAGPHGNSRPHSVRRQLQGRRQVRIHAIDHTHSAPHELQSSNSRPHSVRRQLQGRSQVCDHSPTALTTPMRNLHCDSRGLGSFDPQRGFGVLPNGVQGRSPWLRVLQGLAIEPLDGVWASHAQRGAGHRCPRKIPVKRHSQHAPCAQSTSLTSLPSGARYTL
jgi:hypothetical protein